MLHLVANLENRRATSFLEAARAQGVQCEPLSHEVMIRARAEPLTRLAPGAALRIDSTGEVATVGRLLLRLGLEDARADGRCCVAEGPQIDAARLGQGELLAPRQRHLGFRRYLAMLDSAAPTARWFTPPSSIRTLFDKSATARELASLGVPVAEQLEVNAAEPLFEVMERRTLSAAFVKIESGSSASGLAMLQRWKDGRFSAFTTLARRGDRWFNSLRLQRYDQRGAVAEVLGFLFGERARVEVALPKTRLGGRQADVRVLVVDGQVAATVVRTSAHAITNLHLGNTRGDVEALRAIVEPDVWQRAMRDCVRAAAHLGAFQLGLDVLFSPEGQRYAVLEANAFGDLLPGLTFEGRDLYAHQVHRWLARDEGAPTRAPAVAAP